MYWTQKTICFERGRGGLYRAHATTRSPKEYIGFTDGFLVHDAGFCNPEADNGLLSYFDLHCA